MNPKPVPRPSVSTRTEDFTPRELPLSDATPQPRPPSPVRSRAGQRIREVLRRWFEQEL